MLQNKTFLCVIPARGGSKGLPRKNIMPMDGKPMIVHVIDAARASGIFEDIIVTTDDEEIETVARLNNASVIRRPPSLAEDNSLVGDVMVHALKNIVECDYVLLLEPTSPLIVAGDILRAAKKLLNNNADMIISVCKASPDVATIGRLGPDESMKGFMPKDVRTAPRQNRPNYYYLNSAIYMGKWHVFAKKKDFYEQNTIAFVMHPEDSVHIDTMEDFIKAETLMKQRKTLRRVLERPI